MLVKVTKLNDTDKFDLSWFQHGSWLTLNDFVAIKSPNPTAPAGAWPRKQCLHEERFGMKIVDFCLDDDWWVMVMINDKY